jgi:predicted nucleic acid-binding protein
VSVYDASVFVDAMVVVGPPGDAARLALPDADVLQVPAIFDAEVTSALRAMVRRKDLGRPRARAALEQLRTVRAIRYPFEPFLDRVWELRDNLMVYDAWYVALAERLDVPFVTADERLGSAPGPTCPVRLVSSLS